MRKCRNLFIGILLAFIMIISPQTLKLNRANASNLVMTYDNFAIELEDIFTDFSIYKSRVAGSEEEKLASEYIRSYLDENTMLEEKNDMSVVKGVQAFEFLDQYTGVYEKSQNIIFVHEASKQTKKKVVLATNYDVPSKYDAETGKYISFDNDALNTSMASVASLLLLARTLPTLNLDFNLEFVFLGAGENGFAGSKFYLNGVSDEEAGDILCVINLDKIAIGKNVYFYMDEISTAFSRYVAKTSSNLVSEVDLIHLNKTAYVDTSLNLGYSHVALSSDNANFMSRGLATINIFAGEYDNGLIVGLNEYDGKEVISYTDKDTIEHVKKTYGEDSIADNLYKVSLAIENLLSDSKFIENAQGTYNQNAWFYTIFANENLVLYLTFVVFVIVLIVAMYVYFKLTKKSYYANIETEFLSSVVKISDQIDQNAEDKNIAKVVGQVIANDIKKDKTLKREKKKKK